MRRNAVAWAALVMSAGALIGSRTYTRALPAAQDVPVKGQETAQALSDAFGAVADFVKPSVVQITVETKRGNILRGGRGGGMPGGNISPKDLEEMLKKFFGPDGPNFQREGFQRTAEGLGSGFVYDDKGHILTNNHVVNGADKISVTFYDGTEVSAKLVGTDPETDVAVIKVDTTTYRPVLKGDSHKLKVGQWVLAVGSPFGLSQTVTSGIISATERDSVGINQFENFIQTDASINRGNSGGPLVDMTGRVIGINSVIATASGSQGNAGVGFAIPIDMASRRADKLIRDGKINGALIGVVVDPVNPALARQLGLAEKTRGVIVTHVGEGSPADKSGLKVGDVITTFDGNPIDNRRELQYYVTSSDVGKSYPMTYLHKGEKHEVQVTPQSRESVADTIPDSAPVTKPKAAAPAPVNSFGMALATASPELLSKYGYPEKLEGFVITRVDEDGAAAVAGLEEGDLIQRFIKDKALTPATDLKAFEDVAKNSDEIAVFVRDAKGNNGEVRTLSKPKK